MGFEKGVEVKCEFLEFDIDFTKLRENDDLSSLYDKQESLHENYSIFHVDSIIKAKRLAIKYGYLIEGKHVYCPGCRSFIEAVRTIDPSILTLTIEKKKRVKRTKKVIAKAIVKTNKAK